MVMIKAVLFLSTALLHARALSFGPPEASDKYSVMSQNVSYFEATLACKQGGQELVSIETLDEWQTVVSLLKDLGYDDETGFLLWTSANSLQAPNSTNFYWMSDGSLIPKDAIYWAKGEPNNAGDEQCVIIENNIGSTGGLSINDKNCYFESGYICESD